MSEQLEKLIAEYSPKYCQLLEEAYGKHMMSEGGAKAIERMFEEVNLTNQTMLDFGSGLGGVAFYLTESYQVKVTGVDINPWMIEASYLSIPQDKINQLQFFQLTELNKLPLADNTFDIIFSKGVLTHIEDKLPLFKKFHKLLKPNGTLIIDDWLSPYSGRWGEKISKLSELDELTLYANSPEDYQRLLEQSGFVKINFRNENPYYYQYNLEIIDRLKHKLKSNHKNSPFTEKDYLDSIAGYQLISDALKDKQLLVKNIYATAASNCLV